MILIRNFNNSQKCEEHPVMENMCKIQEANTFHKINGRWDKKGGGEEGKSKMNQWAGVCIASIVNIKWMSVVAIIYSQSFVRIMLPHMHMSEQLYDCSNDCRFLFRIINLIKLSDWHHKFKFKKKNSQIRLPKKIILDWKMRKCNWCCPHARSHIQREEDTTTKSYIWWIRLEC